MKRGFITIAIIIELSITSPTNIVSEILTQQPNEAYYMTIVRSGSLDISQVSRFEMKCTPEKG